MIFRVTGTRVVMIPRGIGAHDVELLSVSGHSAVQPACSGLPGQLRALVAAHALRVRATALLRRLLHLEGPGRTGAEGALIHGGTRARIRPQVQAPSDYLRPRRGLRDPRVPRESGARAGGLAERPLG